MMQSNETNLPNLITINPLWENISIIGSAQQGKTTLAKELVRRWKIGFNIVVFDPHGYANPQRGFTNVAPECVKHTIMEITGKGLEIIQPYEDSKKFFDSFCGKVYSFRNLIVIMDELHNYASKYRAENNLLLLARNCNNRNIGYIAIYQSPAEVPNFILNNSTHRFVFHLDVPTHREYIKKWTGIDGTDVLNKFEGFYQKQGQPAWRFHL